MMNPHLDTVTLSRLQFAVTIMFHMLWPVVTVGLSLFLVALEGLWIRTGDREYYVHARFWGRLFVLFTALGVVTGIPMEFQFGTNWSVFSVTGGDFFGNMLGFEGAMAFMLEATFLGIMLFGSWPIRGCRCRPVGTLRMADSWSRTTSKPFSTSTCPGA
jgi:cytochrome d ubiquinol oxidase subunit I